MTDEQIEKVARKMCAALGVDPDQKVSCGPWDCDTPFERSLRTETMPMVMKVFPRWMTYRNEAAIAIASIMATQGSA